MRRPDFGDGIGLARLGPVFAAPGFDKIVLAHKPEFGAILTTTLLDDTGQRDADTGPVVPTGGVGVGAAMVLERLT